MPKIDSKNGIISYDSEDWLAGIHTQNYSDAGLSSFLQMGTTGFAYAQSIDPYRFLGYLTCGRNTTSITNSDAVLTSYLKQGVNVSDYAFLIEDTKLHYLNVSSHTLLNDSAGVGYPHTLAHGGHTSIVTSDIVLYNHKVGGTSALRGLYSFSDSGDWDIGTFNLAISGTASFDDDFMSTAPATPLASPYLADGKGYPHPMIVGYDDICYIADRNYVHGYDGQNSADNDGKFFPACLTLPKEYIIYGFAKLAPRSLAIFASTGSLSNSFNNARTSVFIWNYLDLDPDYIKEIPENLVSAPFEYNGTVGCFACGRTSYTGLYLLNGSTGQFERVTKYYGSIPINGGVNIIGDEIQWLSGGKVYSYGNQYDQKKVLNCIAKVDYNTSGNGFFRRFLSSPQGDIISTDTKYCFYLAGGYKGSSSYFYTPYLPIGKIRVKKVKVSFATATNGIGLQLYLTGYNQSSDPFIKTITNIGVDDSTSIEYGLDTSGNKIPVLDGIAVYGNFNTGSGTSAAPIIRKIEVYYEPAEYV